MTNANLGIYVCDGCNNPLPTGTCCTGEGAHMVEPDALTAAKAAVMTAVNASPEAAAAIFWQAPHGHPFGQPMDWIRSTAANAMVLAHGFMWVEFHGAPPAWEDSDGRVFAAPDWYRVNDPARHW